MSANLSKKVPLPGIEYSSQQYGASLEIEVSDADKPGAIQARIRELYNLLSISIDEQIGVAHPSPPSTPSLPPPPAPQPVRQPVPAQRNGYATGRNRLPAAVTNGNGNGNGRQSVNATEAQCRAIFAICKSQGISMADVLADFNVADAKDLHVKDASRLIDQLKSQNGNGTAAH
ncbi:MAG: hypothetical protein WCT04_26410 [Planctomycetota bacterium]